jgi:hypothetical protein
MVHVVFPKELTLNQIVGSPVFNGKVLPAVALLAGCTICQANRTAAISSGVSRQTLESQIVE